MLYELITNENFNNIKDYEGPHPEGYDRIYGYKINDGKITFYTNYVCCPCVYYVKKDKVFAFSFDPDLVVKFAKEKEIELKDDYSNINLINENVRKHIKSSVRKRYKYNLNYIENWKKIILHNDGTFEKEDYNLDMFCYDVLDHKEELLAFYNKYNIIVNDFIDRKKFLPTITGGLDTRAFVGFYRDRVNELDGYFLSEVKQDGKNNYEQGLLEMKLAELVVKKIGLANKRYNKLEDTDYTTITGMFNENANEYENPNDPEYVYKVVQHGYDNTHQYINKITPYMDDDYYKFKQDGELFRVLNILILVPDMIHLPFISGTSLFNNFPDGITIYPFLKTQVDRVVSIINYWNNK